MIRIPIGMMDRCITLQNEVKTRGTDGSWLKSWSTIKRVRAAYDYRSGAERFEADQEQANRVVTWTIRYRSDVDEKCRIVHGSDIYDIESVEELGRRNYLKLYARKKSIYQEQ
jgi:SPP1 family predicted phage head-tail adaptor